ncbi:hypothetical protein JAAARDRAFT_189742 [Jaapia argillacea MUCL 33604]|uniref:Uncharacterized protein n=1 Tax=Jaapia argillacea MUCL 33604 TaxID=933084 RepID=A0A067Q8G2_9AGAM|nr:hypothetical protein JAAARDRAFT_189742 [Jaapia argillacea MUCL 33604]
MDPPRKNPFPSIEHPLRFPLITPSASPPVSRSFHDGPSPPKRARTSRAPSSSLSGTPAQDPALDLHSARRDSSLRVLSIWSQLAEKYTRRLDEDDIIDLRTNSVIKDHGVLRGTDNQYEVGFFADAEEDERNQTDGGSEGAGAQTEEGEDDVDEIDAFAPEADISDELELERMRNKVPPVQEMNPADAEDLREFLATEQRRREILGDEEDSSEDGLDLRFQPDEDDDVEVSSALGEVEDGDEQTEEVQAGEVEMDEGREEEDDEDEGVEADKDGEHTLEQVQHDEPPRPTVVGRAFSPDDSSSEDEFGAWGQEDEASAVYLVGANPPPEAEPLESSPPSPEPPPPPRYTRSVAKKEPRRQRDSIWLSSQDSEPPPIIPAHDVPKTRAQSRPVKKAPSELSPPSPVLSPPQLHTPPQSSSPIIESSPLLPPQRPIVEPTERPSTSTAPALNQPVSELSSSRPKPRPAFKGKLKPLDPRNGLMSDVQTYRPDLDYAQLPTPKLFNRGPSVKPRLQCEVVITRRPSNGKVATKKPSNTSLSDEIIPHEESDIVKALKSANGVGSRRAPSRSKGKEKERPREDTRDNTLKGGRSLHADEDIIDLTLSPELSPVKARRSRSVKKTERHPTSEPSSPIMRSRGSKRKRVLSDSSSAATSARPTPVKEISPSVSGSFNSSPESRKHGTNSALKPEDGVDESDDDLDHTSSPPRSRSVSRTSRRSASKHPPPVLRQNTHAASVPPPAFPSHGAPHYDPIQGQYLLAQAISHLTYVMTATGFPGVNQPPQHPWPNQSSSGSSSFPPYPHAPYPHHTPWAPITPTHRSHHRTNHDQRSSSPPSTAGPSMSNSVYTTPSSHHPQPYPYMFDPSMSNATLPPSSPVPSSPPLSPGLDHRSKSRGRSKSSGRRVSFKLDSGSEERLQLEAVDDSKRAPRMKGKPPEPQRMDEGSAPSREMPPDDPQLLPKASSKGKGKTRAISDDDLPSPTQVMGIPERGRTPGPPSKLSRGSSQPMRKQ